jgi:hypothetical protein
MALAVQAADELLMRPICVNPMHTPMFGQFDAE